MVWPGGWHLAFASCGPAELLPAPKSPAKATPAPPTVRPAAINTAAMTLRIMTPPVDRFPVATGGAETVAPYPCGDKGLQAEKCGRESDQGA
ncbi:hypothetical protein GCM10010472_39280 [Pseudonocardia halophobica]|uniref:Uncharacterized protein n=1 Tax=Pseudonocardia halophobica TaxID=29401 RepID=A0A9W6LA42_9PSEU|nr:hypothetical protein GCM10017577_54630 [Pseudonocardia halophobica]